MPAQHFFAQQPSDAGLDEAKVQDLFDRAEREVAEGLLPSCQIAIARRGKIGAMRTFGRAVQGGVEKPATDQTLYIVFSCTKAIMASAAWLLIGEGKLDPSKRAAEYVPEFGTNGKEVVTVEQLLIHTAGFPDAPYAQDGWLDRNKRLQSFAKWRLQWPPGSKYMYHPTSSLWVLAEIIERLTGLDFREFVHRRIATPLGLPGLRLGVPRDESARVADLMYVGEPLKPEDWTRMGLPVPPETEVTETAILGFNLPEVREAGVPGGGAIATAADMALFYQALLAGGKAYDGTPIWKEETLRDAMRVRTEGYVDPVFGLPPNRGLGVVIAGSDGNGNLRGFGRTNSPTAFGHGGAGGQIAWGDPATGISMGYCTNGFDRNDIRQGRRGVAISSRAAVCALE
ncbi:MAG TPA: serine hydrolase domain-containing protein [Candidatus Binataceae bacterium]|nr:serine hydrolase domain-containing protein [Candidatus Binataceae bacterium]